MIFREDVANPEGPVLLPDGRWAILEMDRGIISLISRDGTEKTELAHTGRPNGLALDRDGALWVAESQEPTLLRVSLSGEVTTVAEGVVGAPFMWPNDLCFGPDGMLYMTDSGVLLDDVLQMPSPEAFYESEVDGKVFRIDPGTGEGSVIDQGLRFVNGIAFGPGGDHVYVSETMTGNIYRYRVKAGGEVGPRETFGNVMIVPPVECGRVAGPDGMAFGESGNLYVCVLYRGDIAVVSPDGAIKEHIPVNGTFPTNVAFGQRGERKILITEGSGNQLLLLGSDEDGLPLY